MKEKEKRIKELDEMIHNFCEDYLEEYTMRLSKVIGRKRKIDIIRGKKEIWAASIIYVIARLNFLFDKENKNHITPAVICNYFNVKKSTIGNKATQIMKFCNLHLGSVGFCSKEISDSLTFIQTPEGIIIPQKWFDNRKIEIMIADEKEAKEIEEVLEERRKKEQQRSLERKERQAEINRKIAEEKKKKEEKHQLTIFDEF